MDDEGNGGVSGGDKIAVRMRAKMLNGGHLILNCSDFMVTPLVACSLQMRWTFLVIFPQKARASCVFYI